MSEVVDAIVAELIVRDVAKYERDFDRATSAHDRFLKSGQKLNAFTFDLAKEGQKYKAGADKIGQAEEQLTQRVTRTRKKRADDAVAQDEREVASAKRSAKAKADAEVAEAERSARIRAAVERGVAGRSVPQGSGANLGRTVAREGDGGRAFMANTSVSAIAAADVAAQKEVNYLLADSFDLQQRRRAASGEEKRELGDQLDYLRRIATYERAGLSNAEATARAEREIAAIEKLRVAENEKLKRQMASQIQRNSGGLGSGLRAAAGGLVGAFSAKAISDLNDEYIRLQNSLKIAGLEGENLERVQAKLFDSANRGGVDVSQLAKLYGGLASLQGDLGVSQQQVLTVTDAVADAIKVQGSSAESASGAILGLTQALTQGKVQASEYNQIVEGLRPLLQGAVEGSQKYRGSLNALRDAVLAGKVSSQELFALIESGAKVLREKAASAALTTAQGFTVLRNALVVYFGEADKANGVSAAIGVALKSIADNLNTLIPAIAAVAVALGVKYVGGAVAATLATETLGATLLLALGNPVVLAVAALAGGLTYLALTTRETAKATGEYARQQQVLADIQNKSTSAVDRLATATGKARAEALANAQAVRQETIQYLANAKAALESAKAKAQEARQNVAVALSKTDPRTSSGFAQAMAGAGGFMGSAPPLIQNPGVSAANQADATAQANFRAAQSNVAKAEAELVRINKALSAPPPVSVPAVGSGGAPGRASGAASAGPDPAEVQQRFAAELRRMLTEELQDQLAITSNADKRLEIQKQLNDLEYQDRLAAINDQKDYTAEQKAALRDELNKRFGRRPDSDEIVVGQSPIQIAQQREYLSAINEVRLADLQRAQDALRAEAGAATTRQERARLEKQLLALAQEEERARLEAAISAGEIEDATTARATLARKQSADRRSVDLSNRGPLRQYLETLPDTADKVDEALEQAAVGGLQDLNDGLTDAVKKMLHLDGAAGDFLGKLIEIGIQRKLLIPLADKLFPTGEDGSTGGFLAGLSKFLGGTGRPGGSGIVAGDGGLGSEDVFKTIGSFLGKLGGRASGGNVVAGVPYVVGENGPEIAMFGASGRVFPNGALPSLRGASGGLTVIAPQHFDLSGVVMTEGLIRKFEARNREYANAVAAQAGRAAVAAGPGRLQQLQTLGN